MHIAQGVFKAKNVNKCTEAGGTFVFWVADWFALMNDKMGGDLDKIKVVGEYLIEVWKAAGMDMSRVVFRWASEDITNHADAYWTKMLDIARRFTLGRVKKCCQIMGRKENKLTAAQILYPLMQCTDIFFLRADICQLGVDQRKVNMLAREYCDAAGIKLKPVILSHHMLYGLKAGQAKMSKSDPDSAVFMEDTAEDVERKMMNAYCPATKEEAAAAMNGKDVDESMSLVDDNLKNPCLDYLRYIIFCTPESTFEAGGKTFATYEDAEKAFLGGEISKEELKRGLAKAVNLLLQPVRDHFTNDPRAKELLELVRSYKRGAAAAPAKVDKTIPRAVLTTESAAPIFAVHAPAPPLTAWTPLAVALELLQQIRAKPTEAHQTVLFLPDLSALALSCYGRDKKSKPLDLIRGSFRVLVEAMQLLDAALMKSVHIVWQGELMLTSPSKYWISVINAGRKFQLQTVCDTLSNMDISQAGTVVAGLLHVADTLAIGADAVAATSTSSSLHMLVSKYIDGLPEGATAGFFNGRARPQIVDVAGVSAVLNQKEGNVFDPDAELFLMDDTASGAVKRKMKKAFCEPGNIAFNPVIVLAEHMIFSRGGNLDIKRKEENGGDVDYVGVDALRADFESGKLHPGDLKPGVAKAVTAFYTSFVKKMGKDKDVKAIKKYQKKISKMKK